MCVWRVLCTGGRIHANVICSAHTSGRDCGVAMAIASRTPTPRVARAFMAKLGEALPAACVTLVGVWAPPIQGYQDEKQHCKAWPRLEGAPPSYRQLCMCCCIAPMHDTRLTFKHSSILVYFNRASVRKVLVYQKYLLAVALFMLDT